MTASWAVAWLVPYTIYLSIYRCLVMLSYKQHRDSSSPTLLSTDISLLVAPMLRSLHYVVRAVWRGRCLFNNPFLWLVLGERKEGREEEGAFSLRAFKLCICAIDRIEPQCMHHTCPNSTLQNISQEMPAYCKRVLYGAIRMFLLNIEFCVRV